MMPITILFLSSAEISTPLLEQLHMNPEFDLLGVICQPDKKAGRGQKLTPPATKIFADEFAIKCYQPNKLKEADELLELFKKNPPDLLVTFAYGQILNEEWLNLAKIESLNIHTSLLPKYRGASPIQSALLNGDKVTGISLMRMVKKMDAGPVFKTIETQVGPNETAGTLHDRFAALAAENAPLLFKEIASGQLTSIEQNHDFATHCNKITREESKVDFNLSALENFRKWQAYTPWPSLWATWESKRIKIHGCTLSEEKIDAQEIKELNGELFLGFNDGSLKLTELQLEGKRSMQIKDFLNGNPDFLDSRLD